MKFFAHSIVTMLCGVLMFGCSTPFGQQLASIQQNPATQAAETAAITIALSLATRSPAFSFVAPLAVNGLTALANGSNPTAVTGIVANDVPLITTAITQAIPNSAGKAAALSIANAYTQAMTAPNMTPNPTTANVVIAAIAKGLTSGAAAAAN